MVNVTPDGLEIEFTVTITGPGPAAVALATLATICVVLQLVTEDASVPLKLTVLVPWVVPKFDPVTVTAVPDPPKSGDTPPSTIKPV